METSWEDRIDQFWDQMDDSKPDLMLDQMRELIAQRDVGDGAALFEWASVHDSLGRTRSAIELYRHAIEAGLDDERAPQASLQLASSLRAEGSPKECLAVLDAWEATGTDASAVVGQAPAVVRALALHDLGLTTFGLQVALMGLAETLPRYSRSMKAYAEAMTKN
ncbi:tetratricopeptide repeat protein [Demequina aurantiaca]|uniref:tetratricopeptide repeat protein n=1 Tax=Demequina aurantiaca TaxID=676200 RepID=UPI0007807E2C|nr:tetratricopeptide repeat protein [Demequina aurantiaca]